MIKIPYGRSSFKELVDEKYFYQDRSIGNQFQKKRTFMCRSSKKVIYFDVGELLLPITMRHKILFPKMIGTELAKLCQKSVMVYCFLILKIR